MLAAEAAPTFEVSSWFFENVWLVPALPAASFLITLLFGKRLLGAAKVHFIGLVAVGAALILSLATAATWISQVEGHSSDEAAHAVEYSNDHCYAGYQGSDDDHSEDADGSEDADHSDDAVTDDAGHDEDASAPRSLAFTDADTDHGDEPATDDADHGEESEVHAKPLPVVCSYTWFQSGGAPGDGGATIPWGTLVDDQSVLMLVVVTFISFLVHIFSTDYVSGDRRYTHYFAFLSLFTASMLFYVVSASTIQMIVGWELVGVCSFALIGHWWEDSNNSDAALKAFLTNRVGDIGLLVGMIILFFAAGNTFDILELNHAAVTGSIGHGTLLVASLCLLAAVMSKSGQFILHTWLPDAMAGPTPVSALIHAATMVVAGIYMVGRLYPVFWDGLSISGSSLNVLAVMGGITCLGGGALAFVQRDIKKVLAYSTISQLGYMAMALGVGAWTAAMFHLFTHAIFKACLFLGAGSVSHACHHSFDMKSDMGGLRKHMPKTFATFVIASGALAGIPPLAGFWSKDEILVGTGGWPGTDGNGNYTIVLAMGLITAAMTAAYMTRVIWLTFFGTYRGHVHPHESGPRITIPLQILAGLAVVVGFLNVPAELPILGDAFGLKFEFWFEPGGGSTFPVISHAKPSFSLAIFATLLALGSAALVWSYYKRLYAQDNKATEYTDSFVANNAVVRAGHTLLVEKFYLDHLYTGVIAGSVKGPLAKATYWFNQNVLDGFIDGVGKSSVGLGRFIYRFIDQGTIDGAVNASGVAASESGQVLRRVQSGRIRQYGALMFGASVLLAAVFIVAI